MKRGYVQTIVKLTLLSLICLAIGTSASAIACVPGTGTPGYWMNHPEAWPCDSIWIGGQEYLKCEAIEWMKRPVKGDKTLTLFPALVAAKLNYFIGNPYCCIMSTIEDADWWMYYHPPGSGVKANSPAWQNCGEALYCRLDAYNNGLLCAPSRDALE